MGMNVGVEANGKGEEYNRPVVVIKGFNIRYFKYFCQQVSSVTEV